MGPTHDTGGDSARKRAWRAGRWRARVAALLGLIAPLLGFGWGAPGVVDPSPDALLPLRSLLAIEAWPLGDVPVDKYPEGGYLVSGVVERLTSAVLLGEEERAAIAAFRERVTAQWKAHRGDTSFDVTQALLTEGAGQEALLWKLVLAGRVATLLLLFVGLLAVGEVAMAACGPRFGWVAVLALALQPAVVHYGATLNTDVPALAWCAIGWALLVAEGRGAGRARLALVRVVAAGAALGLAAATKDQYAAVAPGIALFAWGRGKAPRASSAASSSNPSSSSNASKPSETSRLVRFVALAVGVVLAYGATSGVLHPMAWRGHLALIFGAGSDPFRQHDLSLAGIGGLLHDTVERLRAAAGVTGAAGSVLLVLFVIVRRRWRALAWLAPAVGYTVLFLAPAGYVYPRFTLPIGLCGAIGLVWGLSHASGGSRRQRLGVMVLALLFAAAEAVEVVTDKWGDVRPRAVAALAQRRQPDDEVAISWQRGKWPLAPYPPIAGPARYRDHLELADAIKHGEPPPRHLWLALDRFDSLATPESLDAIAKKWKLKIIDRFEPTPDSALANDPDGLMLPLVVLFERADG